MKKFGKFLLFTAGVAAVCGGVYYYLKNKEKFSSDFTGDDDDDYDDFSEDLDDTDTNRSYVPLNHDTDKEEESFKKLSTLVSDAASTAKEKVEEKVEEFFDEDDDSNQENK